MLIRNINVGTDMTFDQSKEHLSFLNFTTVQMIIQKKPIYLAFRSILPHQLGPKICLQYMQL